MSFHVPVGNSSGFLSPPSGLGVRRKRPVPEVLCFALPHEDAQHSKGEFVANTRKLDVHIARKSPQDPLLDVPMYRHFFNVPLVAMVMGKFTPALGVQAVVLSVSMQMATSRIRPMQVLR